MPRCLIVQPIDAVAAELLQRQGITVVEGYGRPPAEIARLVREVDAVITRNGGLPLADITASTRLRVIAVHGAGTDCVPLDVATAHGIAVTNTPEANIRSVAEHAWSLLLAVAKRVAAADAAVRGGDFDFKYRAASRELCGGTLGLVGFGRVARIMAGYGRAFGLDVVALSPRQPDDAFRAAGVVRATDLGGLLAGADFVSLHVPLNAATRGMIGAAELARMRPDAILVNTSRGAVVDEAALAAWLATHPRAGAGIDVFAEEPPPAGHPLLALPNAVLSPHSAASSGAALRRMATEAAEAVIDVLAGRRPRHLVNPDVANPAFAAPPPVADPAS